MEDMRIKCITFDFLN